MAELSSESMEVGRLRRISRGPGARDEEPIYAPPNASPSLSAAEAQGDDVDDPVNQSLLTGAHPTHGTTAVGAGVGRLDLPLTVDAGVSGANGDATVDGSAAEGPGTAAVLDDSDGEAAASAEGVAGPAGAAGACGDRCDQRPGDGDPDCAAAVATVAAEAATVAAAQVSLTSLPGGASGPMGSLPRAPPRANAGANAGANGGAGASYDVRGCAAHLAVRVPIQAGMPVAHAGDDASAAMPDDAAVLAATGGGGGPVAFAGFPAEEGRPVSPKPWHHRAHTMHDNSAAETSDVCSMLQEAVAMRQRYQKSAATPRSPSDRTPSPVPHYEPFAFAPEGPPARTKHVFELRRGVMAVWESADLPSLLQEYESLYKAPVDFRTFTTDLGRLHDICNAGPVYTFCVRRLALLESRYRLHTMEREAAELQQMRANPHRDYYNCRKVDTHIHLAAAMNQKHLLRFIKKKMKAEADEPVIAKGGRTLTLRDVCDELRLSPYDINLDSLGMHADSSTFRRFDKFNLKYNPLGDASLREIFLKTDNDMKGRYFAEITKELFADLEESKYVNAEYRLSIYGRRRDEWAKLADWVVGNRLWSPNNRWLIQVPRLYHLYRANGTLRNFEQFLDNLFAPLFEATRDPASHEQLHLFLQQVVGFDCVDDESKPDTSMPMSDQDWARGGFPAEPRGWTAETNPHYAYYIYYIWANLCVLNQMRRARGFSIFDFRPHAGEAGELSHLHAAFLCAHGINHGLMLRRSPPLQYLFYLTQLGIAMSPLSNNMLFCELAKNPFPLYFVRGLNVCLSTDDPLMFHYTKEPLMEEYCIARHTWQLSPADLAEVFRASVLHSSFEPEVKAYWLGADYWRPGAAGNDITRTNVPDIRLAFRDQAHREELQVVYESAAATPLHASVTSSSSHPKLPNAWEANRGAPPLLSVEVLSRAHEQQRLRRAQSVQSAVANANPSASAGATMPGGAAAGTSLRQRPPLAPAPHHELRPSQEKIAPNMTAQQHDGRRSRRRSSEPAPSLAPPDQHQGIAFDPWAGTRLGGAPAAAEEGDEDEGAGAKGVTVLGGVPLSTAVAIGVGAVATAASIFAAGVGVALLLMHRGGPGGHRRRGI